MNNLGKEEFEEFARRIGVNLDRTGKLIEPFLVRQDKVESLTQRSFLNDAAKRAFTLDYNSRRNRLIK